MPRPDKFDPAWITLGWKLRGEDPAHFCQDGKLGGHTPDHLVRVPATSLNAHTAILAQSGAGKSFLLGRLIEEIILKTTGRCVILDPNADYGRISSVNPQVWTETYRPGAKRLGFCPTESSGAIFSDRWGKVQIEIASARPQAGQGPIAISWIAIPAEALGTDLEDPMQRLELRRCHDVHRAVAKLLAWKEAKPIPFSDIRSLALRVLQEGDPISLRRTFESRYAPEIIRDSVQALVPDKPATAARAHVEASHHAQVVHGYLQRRQRFADAQHADMQTKVASALEYYSGLLDQLSGANVEISTYCPSALLLPEAEDPRPRIKALILPSIRDQNSRLLAVSSVVSREWSEAQYRWEGALRYDDETLDARAPTYIVVDEAHHVMPRGQVDDARAALREQFRSIAGEGRKYGVFLVVVSQRPDKIDERILSECRNVLLLQMKSKKVLEETASALGVDRDPLLSQCLALSKGMAIIAGDWAPVDLEGDLGRNRVMFVAARRTVQGGRDLQEHHWARPLKDLVGPENA